MKRIKCDLLKFKDSKLPLNHKFMCSRTVEISFLKSMGLGLVTIKLVLSANNMVLDLLFITISKSFT